FSYCGGPYPELERDLDFDFIQATVFTRYSALKSMSAPNTKAQLITTTLPIPSF
ncbi:DUF2787 family protein, partial [Vibrio crassostreae]|uniref:DUF2787 family protein n=1 Tax=Vibrio crassostreae TaxID=246167 RepID=UPI001B30F75E